ncbi:MAG: hypothetical protein FJ034_01410 [Chloroflexi bacterium]|nr:hypothetical protein [Chloroflexota bacterium]
MFLRAELYCYFCGHGYGEVLIPARGRRPSVEQLRAAYEQLGREERPVWDDAEGGQPLCPRCNGQLFLEKHEHEVVRRAETRPLKRAS